MDESASKVPKETLYLVPKKAGSGGPWGGDSFSITDQYFAMPLYQIFNEEMIDYEGKQYVGVATFLAEASDSKIQLFL